MDFNSMDFNSYRYIWPPRPETKISPSSIHNFETGEYLGQPKLNGSCMQLYTDGDAVVVMNRHKQPLAYKIGDDELRRLHRGNGWMVLCGEYMNKGQKDETGRPWIDRFVVFDIIVHEGKHLLGTTFEERHELLRKLYPDDPVKKHLHRISENCFRVGSTKTGFTEMYEDITRHPMYEGLVMKLARGRLENGTSEMNNVRTQIKCRKPTKNYAF